MVKVELGGRVVDADAGGPVGNVRVSVSFWDPRGVSSSTAYAKETATSGGDGTFTLPITLPPDWTHVALKFTGPAGYDDTGAVFVATGAQCPFSPCGAPADRPAIRMYPTLVISPGESIEVRIDGSIPVLCGWDGYACRRVLVAASSGDPVELEVASHASSEDMALGLAVAGWGFLLEPDMSVRRLMVPPGGVPYVIGAGTATVTARR